MPRRCIFLFFSASSGVAEQLHPTFVELLVVDLYCLIVSPCAIFVNILTIILIRKNTNLHSTCFSLISLQSVISCQMSLGFFTWCTLSRLHLPVIPRVLCTLLYAPSFTSASPLSALVPCAIAVDRLIAISWILKYEQLSKHLLRTTVTLCVLIGCIHSITAVATTPSSQQIGCWGPLLSLHPTFAVYYLSVGVLFFALSVLIYAFLEVGIRHRRHKVSPMLNHTSATHESFLAQQMALLPLIKGLLVTFILFAVIPHSILTIAPYVDNGRHLNRLSLYGSSAKLSLAFMEFVVLATRSMEFRKSLLAFCRFRQS